MQTRKPLASGQRVRRAHGPVVLTGMLLLCATLQSAEAQEVQSLQKCLAAFSGLNWSLPYSPRLSAGNCRSEGGRASLELFSHAFLEADSQGLSSGARFAAEKTATFAWFDALFLRQGYRLQHSEAATDEDFPYVQRARYVRSDAEGDSVLSYEVVASNVCRITHEKTAGRGAAP